MHAQYSPHTEVNLGRKEKPMLTVKGRKDGRIVRGVCVFERSFWENIFRERRINNEENDSCGLARPQGESFDQE